MSKGIEPRVPKAVVKDVVEQQPNNAKWSEEFKILIDPSIAARPLDLPDVGTVEILNHDCKYRWVHIGFGNEPRWERVQQLKHMGFDFATPEDVRPLVAAMTKDRGWIQSGDRVLMKCPIPLYRSYIKRNMLNALAATSPRNALKDREVMTTLNSMPGATRVISDEEIDGLRSNAVLDSENQSLEERATANASIPTTSRRK